jgi:hypothetical protein
MKTQLTEDQIDKLNNLIEFTILPALQEDICIPDMSDKNEEDKGFEECYDDRVQVLYRQATNYLSNNII